MDPKTYCIPCLPFSDFPVTTSRLEQFTLHSQFKLNPNSIFSVFDLLLLFTSALSVPDWLIKDFLHLLLIRCHLGSSAQLFCEAPFPVLSLMISPKPLLEIYSSLSCLTRKQQAFSYKRFCSVLLLGVPDFLIELPVQDLIHLVLNN